MMGCYRGVKHKPRQPREERIAEREREMRESSRGKVQGRQWLKNSRKGESQ